MKIVVACSAAVLLVSGVIGVAYFSADKEPYLATIEQILETPQTYGTEAFDRLVALGPEAVPAIGQTLSRGVEFPMELVNALGEIGDVRGAEPILAFIEDLAPYGSADESHLTALAIGTLSSIPSSNSCAPLVQIMRSGESHPRVQLASAGTVARVCEGVDVREAVDLLLRFYDERFEYFSDRVDGFVEPELYVALAKADDPRISEILLPVMDSSYSVEVITPIIEFAKRQPGEDFAYALSNLLDDRQVLHLRVRLDIARHLLARPNEPSELLTARIEELQAEAEASWPALVEEARKLGP
jgi:hypothetical protein